MIRYPDYRNRLIEMTRPYPIYDREDDEKIIGYTKAGDRAVVTYSNVKDNYHEVVIVSGEYAGVDTLALHNNNLKTSVFIFNNIDKHDSTYINGARVKCEFV